MEFQVGYPHRIVTGWPEYTGPEWIMDYARHVGELGYWAFHVGDHLAVPKQHDDIPTPYWFDPATFLAWLTTETKMAPVINVYVIPYRSPFHTAKLVSTLDVVSGGRAIMSAGVGYLKPEFEQLGVPWETRGAMTDDYIRAMKVLWTQDEAAYDGEFVKFKEMRFWPKPIRKPHPPVWIGGQTKLSLYRAARLGDGWNPFMFDLNGMRDAIGYLEDYWAQKDTRERPENFQVVYGGLAKITDNKVPESGRAHFHGTPEQILLDIERYADHGITFCSVGFDGTTWPEQRENMERFAKEVMPKAKAIGPGAPY